MSTPYRVAIDLGAGSGRALLGRIEAGGFLLEEVHRFHYAPRRHAGHLRWDMARLLDGLGTGIRSAAAHVAARRATIESVGVDSWGVDYGLLDSQGRLLEDPVAYRDERTNGAMEQVFALVSRDEIFARTGIQFLQLNTLYQLFVHAREGLAPGAARLLMIPDLCHHHLCGSVRSERTNASTTQLLDAHADGWDDTLFERLGLPRSLMPELVPAGTRLGRLLPERRAELGVDLEVFAPASHDTASAVAGTPLTAGWAFISSGTWSLVGVERPAPLLGEAVAQANFTNEAGAFGTVRFLKNVMGLWLLESCRREWDSSGQGLDLEALLAGVSALPGFAGFVFPDHPRFFNPPSMVAELRSSLEQSGQQAPLDPVRLTKVILDSLALRYASVLETIETLTGRTVPGVHVVGGGSLNDYLNQATADAAARPVAAGPAEATAVGNLLVQAVAGGDVKSLSEGRALLEVATPPRRFVARHHAAWAEATRRYRDVEAFGGG